MSALTNEQLDVLLYLMDNSDGNVAIEELYKQAILIHPDMAKYSRSGRLFRSHQQVIKSVDIINVS